MVKSITMIVVRQALPKNRLPLMSAASQKLNWSGVTIAQTTSFDCRLQSSAIVVGSTRGCGSSSVLLSWWISHLWSMMREASVPKYTIVLQSDHWRRIFKNGIGPTVLVKVRVRNGGLYCGQIRCLFSGQHIAPRDPRTSDGGSEAICTDASKKIRMACG